MRATRESNSPVLPHGLREEVGQRVLALLVVDLSGHLATWMVVHAIGGAVDDVVLRGQGFEVLAHDLPQ